MAHRIRRPVPISRTPMAFSAHSAPHARTPITAAAKKERRRLGRTAGGFGSRRRMDRMFRILMTT